MRPAARIRRPPARSPSPRPAGGAAGQPRGQVRARRQPLSDPPRHRRQRHPPAISAALRRRPRIQLREIIQDRLLRRLLLRRARNRGTSPRPGNWPAGSAGTGAPPAGAAGSRAEGGTAAGGPAGGWAAEDGAAEAGAASGGPGRTRARGRSIRVRRIGTGDRGDQRTEIHLIRPRQALRGTRAPSITHICRHRVTSSAEHLNPEYRLAKSVLDQSNEGDRQNEAYGKTHSKFELNSFTLHNQSATRPNGLV